MTDSLEDLFADDPAALAAAVIALAPPAVEPPPGLREKLLAALPDAPPPAFKFADGATYRRTRHPGVSVRVLHTDRVRNAFTCLMKLEPGASIPGHDHDGPEECLVLEGTVTVGSVTLRPGDYQRCEPGTEHVDQISATGALLYITAPLSLLSA